MRLWIFLWMLFIRHPIIIVSIFSDENTGAQRLIKLLEDPGFEPGWWSPKALGTFPLCLGVAQEEKGDSESSVVKSGFSSPYR